MWMPLSPQIPPMAPAQLSARLHLYGNGHPGTMLVGGPQSTT